MLLFVGKFVDSMLNPQVFLIAQTHKAVITSPAVRVNNAFKLNATTEYALRYGFRAVRHDFSANMAITFKQAVNNDFTKSVQAYDAANQAIFK